VLRGGKPGEAAMPLGIKIVVWWTLLSGTLGPCLTWLFFYGDRRHQRGDVVRSAAGLSYR